MMKRIMDFFKSFVLQERSPGRLAFSFCLGNFIAFSPFLGMHTAMVFACSWLFQLNLAVMLGASMAINNIWTLVPIYMSDYVFGFWLVHRVTNLGVFFKNPAWMNFINVFFEQKLGLTQPCIWSFLIGGNILGLMTSLALYPIMKRVFAKLCLQIHGNQE